MASGGEEFGDLEDLAEVPERDVIKFNLEVFMPYICDCVEAPNLLTHLQYYTREQRKKIFSDHCRGRGAEATRMALDILIDKDDEPGRFTELRDVLQESNYPKIVKLLKGKYIPSDEHYRRIIDLFTGHLIQTLAPIELLPLLREYGVLEDGEAEEVRAEELNHGKTRASWILLFYLPNRVEDWFKKFLTALIECKAVDVAKELDPDMFEKIVAQRQFDAKPVYMSPMEDTVEHVMTGNGGAVADAGVEGGQAPKYIPETDCNAESSSVKSNHGNIEINLKQNKGSKINKNLHGSYQPKSDVAGISIETPAMGMKLAAFEKDTFPSISVGATFNDDSDVEDDSNIAFNNDFDADPTISTERETVNTSDEFVEEVVQKLEQLGQTSEQSIGVSRGQTEKDSDFSFPSFEQLLLPTSNDSKPDNEGNASLTIRDETQYSSLTEVKKAVTGEAVSMDYSKKSGIFDNCQNTERKTLQDVNCAMSEDARSEVDNHTSTAATVPAASITTTVEGKGNTSRSRAQGGKIKYTREFLLECCNSPLANHAPPEILKYPEIARPSTQRSDPDLQFPRDVGYSSNLFTTNLSHQRDGSHDRRPSHGALSDLEAAQPSFSNLLCDTGGAVGGANYSVAGKTNTEDDTVAMEIDVNNLNYNQALTAISSEDYNITTDEDELPADQDKEVELRDYQEELARDGCTGENVVVMAPTNTGKTHVAARIIQVHFKKYRQQQKTARAVFVVENEALAIQQGRKFAELLPAYRSKIITGSSQRDKKEFLKDFVYRRDILVVTAQVLVNTLQHEEIDDLYVFTLIVFDECHHANDLHPYNQIMSKYLDLKLKEDADISSLPQVVGLTASLGVGGNLEEIKAMAHMKTVMANLDAKLLCTVRTHVDEMKEYENPPFEEILTVRGRCADFYRGTVVKVMTKIEQYMLTHSSVTEAGLAQFCQVPACHGSEQFIQWVVEFKKNIAKLKSDKVRRVLNPCQRHLEVYNKALMIHEDARITDAQAILQEFMADVRVNPAREQVDDFLFELYIELSQISFDDEPENPKLLEMQRLLLESVAGEDRRGIVFVKTRELAHALVHWTQKTPALADLNASEFVGQNASASDGGMTKCSQRDTLDYFDDGKHKLVMATSVADEGLDITKCNLVIRYEHVTNEIVRLQSRGRARAPNSRYYVLTKRGSKIAEKEEKNARLEIVMKQLVPKLQKYIENQANLWEDEMKKIQLDIKWEEKMAAQRRKDAMLEGVFELQCVNCGNFICMSSDVRKIQNAHHVVIDEAISERVNWSRSIFPMYAENELKFDGELSCKECFESLGGVCEYKKAEFPLIKIACLRIVDKNGNGRTCKKWKKANLHIEAFSLDDLRAVVEQRMGLDLLDDF